MGYHSTSGSRPRYCRRVVRGLPIVIVLALALSASVGGAVEQTVTPIEPRAEQRVVPVDQGQTQRVDGMAAGTAESVTAADPPSPAAKAFMAAVISLASMAASIMFI